MKCDRCESEFAEHYYKDKYSDEIICEDCLLELDGITTSTITNYFIDGEYIGSDGESTQDVVDNICDYFGYKELIQMSEADKMFEELGYEKWIDSRNITHFIHKKKEKDFTFMNGNCYSIKRPTKKEQIAINKKVEELGWI